MSNALEFGILAFSSLFAMLNPVSAAPMFVQMTQTAVERRRRIALRACIAAGIALALFAVAGTAIFNFFGITVPAFQIAGGLLFTISAFRTLQGLPEHEAEATGSADPSIVPIGIPLIAGAGSLSTVMVLSGQARSGWHQAALGVAIGLNILATLIVLLAAPKVVSKLGHSGQEILAKTMGLLTAVIGIQFILNGISAVALEFAKQLGR